MYVSVIARMSALSLWLLVLVWSTQYLGGLSSSPFGRPPAGASTAKIFNWHPVLMTLSFGVLMSEALFAYRTPLIFGLDRAGRKKVHWVLQSLAVLTAVLGVVAAVNSHNFASPPIPNLYSPHSYLGVATLVLLGTQFVLGLLGYLYPKFSLSTRSTMGPYHRLLGLTVYLVGLTTMAVGVQEKTTFIQAFEKKKGEELFTTTFKLPAAIVLLIVGTAGLVLLPYTSVYPSPSSNQDRGGSHLSERDQTSENVALLRGQDA